MGVAGVEQNKSNFLGARSTKCGHSARVPPFWEPYQKGPDREALLPQCTAMWGAKPVLPVAYKSGVLRNVTVLLPCVSVAYKPACGRDDVRSEGRDIGPAPAGAAPFIGDGGEHG